MDDKNTCEDILKDADNMRRRLQEQLDFIESQKLSKSENSDR